MDSRREFLGKLPLAAALSAAAVQSKPLPAIGVQLYTVRSLLPAKALETLRAIQAIGYREVEATATGLDKLWPSLTPTNLKPVSVHLDSAVILRANDEEIARTVDDVKRRGFQFAVFPYLPPAQRGGLDKIRALAEKLNSAGQKFRAAGIAFGYHNHAFEFEPMDGTTPLQVLLDHTDNNAVFIELDVFWASVAGQDPAGMLEKLHGRVRLVHLKDKAAGTPVQYNESVPKTTFREVGNGVLDWKSIIAAAESAGVSHYFVEQDQTPGDPVESLRQSFQYLSAHFGKS